MDGALVDLLELGGDERHALGDGEHRALQLRGGERPIGEALGRRLGARDGVAGQEHLHRRPHPEEPRMKLVVGRAHEARGRVADLGVFRDVHQIAARRQLAAPGQAIPVHLGHDGLGEVPDPEPAVDDVARPLSRAARGVIRLVDRIVRAEVVASAEGRARAPQHGHLHARLGVCLLERGENGAAQLVVQRIALLGPVHREAPDAGARVIDDKHVARGHAGPPWPGVIGLESTRKFVEGRCG